MRPENVLAWSVGVETGAPPPSQPPFDQFGNPVVDVDIFDREWKRELEASRAERREFARAHGLENLVPDAYVKDSKGESNQSGNPVADVDVNDREWKRELEASRAERRAFARAHGLDIESLKANAEASRKDGERDSARQDAERQAHPRAERKAIERGFRQWGSNGLETGSLKVDGDAATKDGGRDSTRQQAERQAHQRTPWQQGPLTLNPGSGRFDGEARRNDTGREKANREERARMRGILFSNSVPQEVVKSEPKPYQIPQRKPVPKPSNDTPSHPPLPPRTVLLKNGEMKRVEDRASYNARVRQLGYPELLCPVPIRERSGVGVNCTGAKVVQAQENDRNENGDLLGDVPNQHLTPEWLALAEKYRTLKPGQERRL